MRPRKQRIALIILAVVIGIIFILSTLLFLYIKTDMFRSKEELFLKYLCGNLGQLENFKSKKEETDEFETNKYISNISGNIKYTENIGTSDEKTSSPINDVGIKIESNVDKINDFQYSDIKLVDNQENLVKFEYIKDDDLSGIRLNGIKQFITISKQYENKNIEQIKKVEEAVSDIKIDEILQFTQEEKEQFTNKYAKIIKENIPSNRYSKQKNAIITINNKDCKTNCYTVTLTIEELNNIYIKLLEEIKNDEILISKITKIENQLNEVIGDKNEINEKIIGYIDDIIEKIKDNNIGNEEVKISVYEHNRKVVRTEMDKITEKIKVDFYNDSTLKITSTEIENDTYEKEIIIQKENITTTIEYKNSKNGEILNQMNCTIRKEDDIDRISTEVKLEISNEKNKVAFELTKKDAIVDEFEEEINIKDNSVKYDELTKEKQQVINDIVIKNIEEQKQNLIDKVTLEEYKKMFSSIGVINEKIEVTKQNGISDLEKNRFNSRFEFFQSEGLTNEQVLQLIGTCKNSFKDMKIMTKNNKIEELELEKIKDDSNESRKYTENISEILIAIKDNSTEEKKYKTVNEYFNLDKNNKYDVSLTYGEDGLVNIIRIKIVKE